MGCPGYRPREGEGEIGSDREREIKTERETCAARDNVSRLE